MVFETTNETEGLSTTTTIATKTTTVKGWIEHRTTSRFHHPSRDWCATNIIPNLLAAISTKFERVSGRTGIRVARNDDDDHGRIACSRTGAKQPTQD